MEQPKSKVANIIDNAKELLQKKTDLFLLGVADKASKVISSIAVVVLLAAIGIFILFFGGVAIAWWLGERIGSIPMGFTFVTLFFVLLFILAMTYFKKVIQYSVINAIIKNILHDSEN